MTEQRFEELVNLYLDREISADQLRELKAELAQDPDLHTAFVEQVRLESASRKALFSATRRTLAQRLNGGNADQEPQETDSLFTFGFIRWCALCTCILLAGVHWIDSTHPQFSLTGLQLFEPLDADGPASHYFSIADIVEARDNFTSQVFQPIHPSELSVASVNLPDSNTIEGQEAIKARNIVAANAEHTLARPLEIYPFYGNVRQAIPANTPSSYDLEQATVHRPISSSSVGRYHFYSAGN